MILEEYRDTEKACRDQVSKVKAHLELNLSRDVRGKKGGFYRYISRKRKTGSNVDRLLNGTEDTEKTSVLSVLFSLVSTGKTSLQ